MGVKLDNHLLVVVTVVYAVIPASVYVVYIVLDSSYHVLVDC